MRALTHAAICGTILALASGLVLASGAEAQSRRPLSIEIKPRSWLDAGRVVPAHSMQHYVYDSYSYSDHARFGARGGSHNLPDRFSAGRGLSFETPILLDR